MTPQKLMKLLLAKRGYANPNAAAVAMEAAGIGKKGAMQSALRRFIELGRPLRAETMAKACEFLGVDVSVFASDIAATNEAVRQGLIKGEKPNVESGPDLNKKIYPLISDVQAGMWTDICDNFQPGDADEWHPSARNLGRCGYLLRVVGKSMYAPGEEYSFSPGMLLHVNPDIEPLPGMFVIVRREGTKEATFKRYIMIEGAPYLEAINPDWPRDEKYLKLQPGDVWCGVVADASMGKMPGV